MTEDEKDFLRWLVRRVERDEWDGAQLRGLQELLTHAMVGAGHWGDTEGYDAYDAALQVIAGTTSAQELMSGEWAGFGSEHAQEGPR